MLPCICLTERMIQTRKNWDLSFLNMSWLLYRHLDSCVYLLPFTQLCTLWGENFRQHHLVQSPSTSFQTGSPIPSSLNQSLAFKRSETSEIQVWSTSYISSSFKSLGSKDCFIKLWNHQGTHHRIQPLEALLNDTQKVNVGSMRNNYLGKGVK